jgi:murein L,D-transpeptidase YcbB/YkuD
MRRVHKASLLAGASILALLGSSIVLMPASVSAQTIAPGEPSARAPIALAQTSVEAKPNIDKLIPVPEEANVPPPGLSDVGSAPVPTAPAVTVAPPTPNPTAAPEITSTTPPAAAPVTATTGAPTPSAAATPQTDTAVAPASPAYTGKDLSKAPIATSLAASDAAVAEKVRDLLAGKSAKYQDRKKERDAVEAFYRDRGFAPLWIENGQANSRAASTIAYFKTADADGLEPTEYVSPELKAGLEPEALADAELKLTNAALTYARHAAIGRVSFTRISNDIYYDQDVPEPAAILAKLALSNNTADVLASYLPQHPAYKALKAKYAEARAKTGETGPARIPNGPALKLGKDVVQDPRVPLLRERLGIKENANDTTYDKTVADAVKKYQADKKLTANGVLNQATIDTINGPRRDKDAEVIFVNLERWRWLPHDLRGNTYVMVNIPDYSLKIVSNSKEYWKTRIVVGKPGMPTPIISPDMKFITVNPTWNVPPSIIANEYLPALRQDPNALSRIGLRLEQNKDGTVRIFQPPGEGNALGRIRFNFPNKFLVYQHDTPDKQLFAQDKRAFSHGCMRVQNPLTYAEKLLSIQLPSQGYSEERIKKMLGTSEINIDFPKALPVHLTYQTAFVDEDGKLQIREDVYGRDARLLQALKTDERKVADIAVEQRSVGSATVSRDALRYSVGGGSNFENPFLFFFQQRPAEVRDDRRGNRNGRRETNSGNFFGLFR